MRCPVFRGRPFGQAPSSGWILCFYSGPVYLGADTAWGDTVGFLKCADKYFVIGDAVAGHQVIDAVFRVQQILMKMEQADCVQIFQEGLPCVLFEKAAEIFRTDI